MIVSMMILQMWSLFIINTSSVAIVAKEAKLKFPVSFVFVT